MWPVARVFQLRKDILAPVINIGTGPQAPSRTGLFQTPAYVGQVLHRNISNKLSEGVPCFFSLINQTFINLLTWLLSLEISHDFWLIQFQVCLCTDPWFWCFSYPQAWAHLIGYHMPIGWCRDSHPPMNIWFLCHLLSLVKLLATKNRKWGWGCRERQAEEELSGFVARSAVSL